MKCIPSNFAFQLFVVFQLFIQEPLNVCYNVSYFLTFLLLFMFVNKLLRLKKLKSKQARTMKFSVLPLKFSRQDCLIQLVSYKNISERCQKDPKLSEMSKVIIYHKVYHNFFQNLLFWRFEFQDDLIYYHIKWLDLLGE